MQDQNSRWDFGTYNEAVFAVFELEKLVYAIKWAKYEWVEVICFGGGSFPGKLRFCWGAGNVDT
jgi:hypothetical protein